VRSPEKELAALAADGLLRSLAPLDGPHGGAVARDGCKLWNFASNDYLGLAADPRIAEALRRGIDLHGAGAGASRLITGTARPHTDLEESLAAAKGAGAALVFSSGFATALGTLPAILQKGDTVILDKLCHACLIDGARLSGATIRVFPHNDLEKLSRLLASVRAKTPPRSGARILVVTESVFSMDGDLCPLREIVDLKDRHGALLLLDEAHAFGVLGPTGLGLAEQLGLQERIDFQMGTLSKAAGLAGGFVATSHAFADLLVNRARSFVFSTAPPPALCHAALAALDLIRSDAGTALRRKLRANMEILHARHSPIVPVLLGESRTALAASANLAAVGFLVPAIRYPTVPRGTARLRVSLSAAHPPDAIESLATLLESVREEF